MSTIGRDQLADLAGCPCEGVTLDKLLRPAVLTVLAGGDLHGYAIGRRVAEMPVFRGEAPDAAGLYRTLRGLSDEGLVTCAWDTSGHGPAKRSYRLTDRGLACLAAWAGTLESYSRAVAALAAAARKAIRKGGEPRDAAKGKSCGCGRGAPRAKRPSQGART